VRDGLPDGPLVIYRFFFRLFLQRIDAELAHAIASRALRTVTAIPGARAVTRRVFVVRNARLKVRALGLTFPSPVGVAAGVDKDASWFESLGVLGFGYVEVGTVTAVAQEGNPRPRVFRLAPDRALLNKMGFPNPGADVVADRLRRRAGRTIVGVNVGKSSVAPAEKVGADYRTSVRRLAPFSDYVVINVSSPNTPGLREMQAVDVLRPLVSDVRSELEASGTKVPILIKIGPDLSDAEVDAVAELAVTLRLDGIVAVNTTVDRSGLVASRDAAASIDGGGVSGPPLKTRALDVLTRLYARAGNDLVLISVGGIETPDDAWERILAGATLIQAHTGFVYGGPAWPRRMNRALTRRVRETGRSSIQDLVGAGVDAPSDGKCSNGSAPGSLPSDGLDVIPGSAEAKVVARRSRIG
jgi:dihydroorotate dehydrogenase